MSLNQPSAKLLALRLRHPAHPRQAISKTDTLTPIFWLQAQVLLA
jgi:hypothetical protein